MKKLIILFTFFCIFTNVIHAQDNYFTVTDTALIHQLDQYQNMDTENTVMNYRYDAVNNRVLELQATPNRYSVYLFKYDAVGNLTQSTSLVLRRDKKTWGSYVEFNRKTFDEAINEIIKHMNSLKIHKK